MRTGKLTGITKILIPWNNYEGERNWSMITINGPIYASKMYAGIKKWVYDNFGVTVDSDWVRHVPLITNSNDPEVQVTEEEANAIVESFIDWMEDKDDAIENQGNSDSQIGTA